MLFPTLLLLGIGAVQAQVTVPNCGTRSTIVSWDGPVTSAQVVTGCGINAKNMFMSFGGFTSQAALTDTQAACVISTLGTDTPNFECDQILCPMVYQPVCGNDGNTYSNSCHAGAAGVAVASQGACPPAVSVPDCGARSTIVSWNGSVTSAQVVNGCGITTKHMYMSFGGFSSKGPLSDAQAACVISTLGTDTPAFECDQILCPAIFRQVCGSDGNTYSNDCMAGAAGVDVVSEGPCPVVTEAPVVTDGPVVAEVPYSNFSEYKAWCMDLEQQACNDFCYGGKWRKETCKAPKKAKKIKCKKLKNETACARVGCSYTAGGRRGGKCGGTAFSNTPSF